MPLSVDHRKALEEMFFKDPLSNLTIRMRTALIFASSFSILLVVYDLKVTSTPWLKIEVPENTPNILHGAISVALVYFLAVFVLYTLIDLWRWKQAKTILHLHSYFDLILKCRNLLSSLQQNLPVLDKVVGESAIMDEKVQRKIFTESLTFLEEVEEKVREVKQSHNILGTIQLLRLTVLDIGLPIILGIIAIFKIGPALPSFIASIFN